MFQFSLGYSIGLVTGVVLGCMAMRNQHRAWAKAANEALAVKGELLAQLESERRKRSMAERYRQN